MFTTSEGRAGGDYTSYAYFDVWVLLQNALPHLRGGGVHSGREAFEDCCEAWRIVTSIDFAVDPLPFNASMGFFEDLGQVGRLDQPTRRVLSYLSPLALRLTTNMWYVGPYPSISRAAFKEAVPAGERRSYDPSK